MIEEMLLYLLAIHYCFMHVKMLKMIFIVQVDDAMILNVDW